MSNITSLRLRQFRSYDDFAIELSPTVNIVVGPNASGKTNLLEAVLLLSGAGTYRAQLADVLQHNKEWARVEAAIGDTSRSFAIEAKDGLVKKRYAINAVHRQRLRFEDIMPIVLFEPENMRLLSGSPELRRDFLDEILALIDPLFSNTKKQYLRVLAQRNKLLKLPESSAKAQLFVWNIRLSELGGYIVEARLKLINEINELISDIYSHIAGAATVVKLTYQSSVNTNNYETNILKKLEHNLRLDLERGFTAYGPHRDDFNVDLKGQFAKTSASRGETRTLVLALKLLQVSMLKQKRRMAPIILLDDVFSELDGARRKALTNYLVDNQTIITTTDADIIAKDFAQHTNTISLS
jgi:DNA replication and repair protein RecF